MSITIPDSTPKFSSLDLASLLHIQGAEKDAIEQKLIAKEQERINTIYPDPTMAELWKALPQLIQKEWEHTEKLLPLAQEIIQAELGVPKSIVEKVIYSLGQDNRNRDTEEFKNPHQSNSSTEFTDEEQRYIAKEQTVRQLQNLLIAGAGYRVFDALETEKYQQKLNAIDPELYPLQHKVMGRALRDMLDPQNIWQAKNNVGKSELVRNEKGSVEIQASGLIFPILVHEAMKGVVEYISASRRNGKRPEVVSEILSVDNHADEHRQMVVGPQLWKQFRDLTYYSLSEMKNQPAEAEKSRYIYALYKKMTETFSAKGYQKFLLMMNDGKDGLGAITSMQELIGEINDQSERFHQQLASQQQKSGRQDQIETTLNFQPTSWEVRFKKYGGDLLHYLQTFYPPEMLTEKTFKNGSKATKLELNFTKKLTNYLDNGGDPDTLIGDIKEKLRTLGGELTKIKAIQRLQSTKDKEQKGESKKVKITLAEIEAQENLLTYDPSWQTDLKEKIADIVQRKGLSERFALHKQHTKEIKDLYRNFLDEKDLPVTEVAKVGRFSIVELEAQQHLVAESDSQDHCVGTATGYRNEVKNWTTKIFSIRTQDQNPLIPKAKARYTIEYNTVSKQLHQFKGYDNSSIDDMLDKTWASHKQELIDVLVELANHYPINGVDSDLQALIPAGSVLRKDGTITPLPDNTTIINNYLAGKEILIGEKPTLVLDKNFTYDQVQKLCAYGNITLNLTNIAPEIKAKLITISAKIIDEGLTSENYATTYPCLKKLSDKIRSTTHVFQYDQGKQHITSQEKYLYFEKERKTKALQFLKDNDMDTLENRAKIEAVKFGTNYVEIWGVKFSLEKLIPQNVKRWTPKQQGYATPSDQEKLWLWKADYNGAEEYYYNMFSYEAECKKQGKKPVRKEDLTKAMKALVWEYEENGRYKWGNLLSILLWMSMSGHLNSDGKQLYRGENGFLCFVPRSEFGFWWCYKWNERGGGLYESNTYPAYPSVYRL